jgi:low temperature requirement protein LtrA
MFGRNGVRDHVALFVNMYLLYFIGQSTVPEWEAYHAQYHIAWGLILINIGTQYMIELRNHKADVWNRELIKRMAAVLYIEAAIVLAGALTGIDAGVYLSAAAILLGIILTFRSRKYGGSGLIDFPHLTERAMLYVVFTFGEMIIVVADYFTGDGTWSWNVIYFSLMAFLIVAGLFFNYEVLYDHIIDRDMDNTGLGYMLIHIFLIFGLNNITTSLEFMRNPAVSLWPKTVFLIGSMLLVFTCMFLLLFYAKEDLKRCRKFVIRIALSSVAFVVLMIAFREVMRVNIVVTVLYIFTVLLLMNRYRLQK